MKTSQAKCGTSDKSCSKVIISEDNFGSIDHIDDLDVADGRTSTHIGSVHSPSRQGTDSIKLNLERQVTHSLTSDNRKSSSTSERGQKYASLGSVLSASEQGADPNNIFLGMGPDFSSDPAGDGPA